MFHHVNAFEPEPEAGVAAGAVAGEPVVVIDTVAWDKVSFEVNQYTYGPDYYTGGWVAGWVGGGALDGGWGGSEHLVQDGCVCLCLWCMGSAKPGMQHCRRWAVPRHSNPQHARRVSSPYAL